MIFKEEQQSAIKTISIVSPVYNEEECVSEFINRLYATISDIDEYDFEVIIVNDGSTDKTVSVLKSLQKKYLVKVINLKHNLGQQAAIVEGLRITTGDAVVVLDSDLQDPPEYIPELIKKWEEGADVVMCLRRRRDDFPLKKITASIYYRLLQLIDKGTIINCGDFYLLDLKVVNEICKYKPKNLYLRGSVARLGKNIKIICIERRKRVAGSSKYTLFKMLKLAKAGLIFTLSKPKKDFRKEHIAVIGGGLSGLLTAYRLADEGHGVVLFEKNEFLGGELSTIKLDSGLLIERFYHHIFLKDKEVIGLFKELGINDSLRWRKSHVAVLNSGKMYPFNTAIDLLRLPFLPLVSNIRMGICSIIIPILNYKKFEKITSKQLIIRFMGITAWKKFWEPMFRLKFDDKADLVAGTWFWARLKDRASSRRGTEVLGYPDGSFQILADRLESKLGRLGVNIRINCEVSGISQTEAGLRVEEDIFDKVICCTDLPSFLRIAPTALKERNLLTKIRHNAVIVVLLETSETISDYYWVNILDKNIPFGVMAEQTNLIPKEEYGTNLIYLGRYIKETDPIYKMADSEIYKLFIESLETICPNTKEKVVKYHIFRDRYAQPIITKKYQKPNINTSISGLYLFSSAHIYPQDRGLNNVILGINKVINTVLYK